MKNTQYIKIPVGIFPQDIIQKYNITRKISLDGYLYVHIKNVCIV